MSRYAYPLAPSEDGALRLAGAWLMLAVTALGFSALYAVVLVVAHTPYFNRWLPSFVGFEGALTLHVTLAAFIWFLAFAAALWNAVCGGGMRSLRWAGFGLGVAGIGSVTVAPLVGKGSAVLSNYLPVLDNSIFLAGLGWFAAGIAFTAVGVLPAMRLRASPRDGAAALRIGIGLALIPVLAAGFSWMAALLTVPGGLAATAYFDVIFWGPGHVLQFAHVLLMIVAWLALAAACDVTVPLAPRAMVVLFALTVAPVLAVPVIHGLYPVTSTEFRTAFTALMSYGSWIVAGPLGILLLVQLARSRGVAPQAAAQRMTLALSIVLFLAGCLAGTAIRGDTTLVPAHYHGTIGAVTLAYMALAGRLLRQFGFTGNAFHLIRWPLLYGGGLALLVLGLAGSGLPRKTGWSEAAGGVEALTMGVAGAGGAVAIAAGALFVLFAWQTVWQCKRAQRRRDSRPRALAITFAAVAVGGIVLAWVGDEMSRPAAHAVAAPDPRAAASGHAATQRAREIEQRFKQGVVMLHARQYEHAMAAFHRVLELAPDLPEAHVNMGFALIGLERYAEARDFFESATALRTNQVNAYYGLAVALEGLKDLPGAIGAMRTYVHLSPADDPFMNKARAALWEWESALEARNRTTAEKR